MLPIPSIYLTHVLKTPKSIIKALKLTFQGFFLYSPFLLISSCDNSQTFAQTNTKNINHSYNYPITPGRHDYEESDHFMKIKIKSSIALRISEFNKVPISELSGIAWDEDEKLLYAVSDEGYLYHFKLHFSNDSHKTLSSAQVVFATRLKDSIGYPLKGKHSDSEGLTLQNGNNGKKGDSKLIISFENKPRIAEYSTSGKLIENIEIQKRFKKRSTYRTKNKALESVTDHPVYGILSAAELPIKGDDIKKQTLYAVSKGSKKRLWHFNASPATNSSITGLETLDDGSILVLERAYQNPITPIIINLRRLSLDNCNEKKECKIETIAKFDGADGWLLDNFEGLAHLQGNEFLLVSDNNRNPLQKTIFLHFEIVRPQHNSSNE